MSIKIIAIADTHTYHRRINLPEADILIHAGDITSRGDISELEDFCDWIDSVPIEHKIIIAGNHDFCFQNNSIESEEMICGCDGTHYLKDSGCEINGIKFWGSPWQPWFCNWAFNLPRGSRLAEKWSMIASETDILITHGPPYGILDHTVYDRDHVGCVDLLDSIKKLKPKYHIFGHIHEEYGVKELDGTKFINASSCTLNYKPTNSPIVFHY